MEKTEFFLRLLLMQGKRPARARLFVLSLPPKIPNVDEVLGQLGCSESQCQAFYYVNENRLQKSLAWCAQPDHHFVACCDKDYPILLQQIPDAPIALFILGSVQALQMIQLAMVGSRRYTPYGKQWGYHFAYELAAAGVVITSGLALGIDSVCHGAALDAKGRTIAVLGSGLLQITPRSHVRLAQEIIEKQGAIVSEFLPDEPALPVHFPRRNRIISGLSQGVMVVEAAIKSGTLITARCALEQGRDVFALPGALDNPGSEGTNWLIQQGAYLVVKPDDIMAHLSGTLQWLPPAILPASLERIHDSNLPTQVEMACIPPPSDCPYPQLFAVLSSQPTAVDRLAEWLDEPVTTVMIQLVELELEGYIRAVSGGYVRNLSKV